MHRKIKRVIAQSWTLWLLFSGWINGIQFHVVFTFSQRSSYDGQVDSAVFGEGAACFGVCPVPVAFSSITSPLFPPLLSRHYPFLLFLCQPEDSTKDPCELYGRVKLTTTFVLQAGI